ncbi:ureidoglycolate lyase [Bordetella sp. 2513F-2]
MSSVLPLPVLPLTPEAFAPYGWVLGKPYASGDPRPGFRHPASDFWHEHVFDTGGGETEVLWVDYRNQVLDVPALEVHWLTEQAIVPLLGRGILHVVAHGLPDDPALPDPASASVFAVPPGQGVCMRPRTWHATRVAGCPARCLMLTRRSTTLDLVAALAHEGGGHESRIVDLASHGLPALRIAAPQANRPETGPPASSNEGAPRLF